MRHRRLFLGVLVALAPMLASADGAPAKLDTADGFPAFCSQWMQKLAERQRNNLAAASPVQRDGRSVLEYVGYGSSPISCTSRVTAPGRPGVGVLVYHELRFRRVGQTAQEARASEPTVLERVEVTEVFRYDGARWSY